MKKIIKCLCLCFIAVAVSVMSAVVYGFYSLPDELYSFSDKELDMGFYTCSVQDNEARVSKTLTVEGEYRVNISLFNAVPVKSSSLTVSNRKYVVPSGEIVGLRLFTDGVMVVGVDDVDSDKGKVNPASGADIKKGDVITVIDGVEVKNSGQVESIISSCQGRELEVEYVRNGTRHKSKISPVYSVSAGRYKTGLWIRDSAAGIGTMTFYEKETGFFACLGHAVCDIDTGEILPLSGGDIVDAGITGCIKGGAGCAGELCGSFENTREGVLYLNDSTGVFGYLDSTPWGEEAMPIALKGEVETGKSQIISTVEGTSKSYYDIEIEKLNPEDKEDKNMIIKITDYELINKTGGIVQGMSGSPIIQNGRLVGAVTHVFLNDTTKGYGIFAETMIKKENTIQAG